MTYLGSNILTDAIQKVTSGDAIQKVTDKIKNSSAVTGAMSRVSDAASEQVASVVANNDAFQVNRERFAVLANTGYAWLDKYVASKPTLFVIGLIGAAASGYGIYRRRKNPEAVTLYSTTGILSAALAFIARPGVSSASKNPPPAVAADSPGALKSTMAWMDKKAAVLTSKSPGWEKKTLTRVWKDVGQGPIQPAVNTLLTKNSH